MDRTVLYREVVRIAGESSAGASQKRSVKQEPRHVPELDAFTKEANNIASQLARSQSSLRLSRPRYLALSGSQKMSESERDDFDYTMRQSLQREQRRVRALESHEQARHEKQQFNSENSWFSNPKAAGIESTSTEHRQGIFFYLNIQLQKVSQALAELQSVRHARGQGRHAQTEAIDDILDTAHGREPSQGFQGESKQATEPPVIPEQPSDTAFSEADAPSMSSLQEEHDSLLADSNATLSKAQKAEQSLREIGELQSELNQHLASQSAQLDSLTSDAFRTTADVSAANDQLERAKRSSKRASRIIIVSSIATGVFLLLLNGR